MSSSTASTQTNELPFLSQIKNPVPSYPSLTLTAYTNITPATPPSSFTRKTILILIHGYPQSPYEWRYLAPSLIEQGYPVFIPDLPGYANSPDRKQQLSQDKLTVGTAILESIAAYLDSLRDASGHSQTSLQDIILITHDRGSRVGHRLTVSRPFKDRFKIKALTIIDIVPTSVQVSALGKPEVGKGYFHWTLLANVEIATKLITSLGGRKWCRDMIWKMSSNPETRQAVDVYQGQYDDEDVVRSSCRDYEAGISVDVLAQSEDQKMNVKIGVPLLCFWSQAGLGRWFDVENVWREWVQDGVDVEFVAVGDGASHYIPEDAHELVGAKVVEWLNRVDV